MDRFCGEALSHENSKDCEYQHYYNLRHEKWRLGLRRRQSVEHGILHEELPNQNESIKIKGDDGTDDIRAAPGTDQMIDVWGWNGYRQNEQGDDSRAMGGQEFVERKQNPVTQVAAVATRNVAVQLLDRFAEMSANTTTKPARIPTKLMTT
jgi:hypothetical protein